MDPNSGGTRVLACSPELRKALRAAYPFGERKHWPYKVWLAEIQRQVGRRNADRKTGELFNDAP